MDLFWGNRKINGPVLERQYLDADLPWGAFNDLSKHGLRAFYRPEQLSQLQVGVSWLNLDTTFYSDLVPSSNYFNLGVETNFYLLSMEYMAAEYFIRSEISHGRNAIDFNTNLAALEDGNLSSKGYYLQLGWMPSSDWTFYVTHEGYKIETFNEMRGDNTQTTNSIGASWNFAKDWNVNTQYSVSSGVELLPVFENVDKKTLPEDWRLFGVTLSYQF